MEDILEKKLQERAVLVGLNADCFTKEQTAFADTISLCAEVELKAAS